jgi:uncharacterized protein (TIGR03435 family)
VGAPVVDNTGLSETFDIALRYSTRSSVVPADAEWPTLLSALEEELGPETAPGARTEATSGNREDRTSG